MRSWWMSCKSFTCFVETDEHDIVTRNSAPIVRVFVGQHIKNLVGWMKRIGGFRHKEFTNEC